MKTFMSTIATYKRNNLSIYKGTSKTYYKITFYMQNIGADFDLSIGGSPNKHNMVVSSINSVYFAGPTSSSRSYKIVQNFGLDK